MHRVSFYVSKMHVAIIKRDLECLKDNLSMTSYWEYTQRYICWTPMEHAKVNMHMARKHGAEAVKTSEKIYLLVRDYTFFHAINEGRLNLVRRIITSFNKELDLSKVLPLPGFRKSFLQLARLRNNSDPIGSLQRNTPSEGDVFRKKMRKYILQLLTQFKPSAHT